MQFDNEEKKKNFILYLVFPLIVAVVSCSLTHFFDLRMSERTADISVLSDVELLLKGQSYFKIGDYGNAVKIYTSERLDTDPIAKTNLAYFYANGIYLDKDIAQAKELYKEAYILDNSMIDNYVAITICHPNNMSELEEIISDGVLNNSIVAKQFIFEICNEEKYDIEEAVKKYIDMNPKSRQGYLASYMKKTYEWNTDYLEENDFVKYIEGADYSHKEKIGSFISKSNSVEPLFGTVIYKLYSITRFEFANRYDKYSFVSIEDD